ncbi:hypothetical protein LOTGIDRAFT_163393 [Lottia gigantea]|uniref:Chitin-binding type-2 domain-containing protein n=1 Tax=Lottia gigantea TaxID=225164 RepID=V4A9A8_LOTGI|nr:hypothetical protein LOTGIDRAFT_163393 [Lottia gigantea]ESO91665.1 hypothetical protein LOTGIDRAFT_163393 [Lottia gigantea]
MKTEATCSVVYIYASFESTHPGSALNEFTDIAVHGKPSVLSIIDDKGRPLYVTYEGRKLNHNNTCYNASFKTLSFKGKPPGADVICRRNGVEKECSRVDLQLSQYNKYLCQENWEHLKNPCEPLADLNQNSNLYHPVESDSKKFIRCDYLGNMYVNQCPEGHTYDPDTYTCGDQSLAETMPGRTPFPDHLKNPCLTAADKTGVQFFGHPTDKTKFVQCDFTKHTWVMGCPDKQVWQQIDRTCTVDFAWHPTSAPVTPDPSIKNPCTTGQEFFPIPHKPDQFIHCANGIMYVQSCAPHMHYDRVKHVCGTGEPIG